MIDLNHGLISLETQIGSMLRDQLTESLLMKIRYQIF